jgi:hypothetical protein
MATVTYNRRGISRVHGQSNRDTYRRVEETTTDAEKDPDIDCERKAKGKRNVQQGCYVHGVFSKQIVGDLCGSEGKEQEEEGTHELAQTRDEHMASSVGKPAKAG